MTEWEEAGHFARSWADKAREATTKRDYYISLMSENGASLRMIGEAVGMTKPGVARVLKRQA